MNDIRKQVRKHQELIVKIRRDLHRIPEPAYTEKKTSAYVADYLRSLGLLVTTGIAEYGVVGLLDSGRPGPVLLMRADMDALPLVEETGLPFASTHPGAMHACGHDAHMAMVLGAATVLIDLRDSLSGSIKFVFQPAEEGPGGAKPMIDAGVMENPPVDYSIGCHLWPEIPQGTIGARPGPFMAAMGRFDIRITGRGGHGAMPHLCVDALEVGTQVVNALQRVVSRQIDPLDPAVVSVGSFHAGSAFNIIPTTCELSGTVRTFNPKIWETWKPRIETIVRGVCDSMGAAFELTYDPGYPPTVNDEEMTRLVVDCAKQVVGAENVRLPSRTMGGEDMSFILQRSKGCFFALGVAREGAPPVHNPRFDFDEAVLPLGVETYCRAALELLGSK